MDDNQELARLLAEIRAGNSRAMSGLLEQLRPWIRGRALSLLGPGLGARLDASDIAQEVHLRAWAGFGQFAGLTSPQLLAWIEEIIHNAIIDSRRRHGATKRDASQEVAGNHLVAGLAADGAMPSQAAMRNEQQARPNAALQRLPAKHRQVFELRLYEGLPFEVVARRVGVSVGNARVLMLRATEKLTSELRDKP